MDSGNSQGLSFELTTDQQLARDAAGKFAEREMKPLLRYLDDFGNTQAGQDKLRELRRKAGRAGLLGLGMPTEYTGLVQSDITIGAVCEEIGRRGGSFATLELPGIFLGLPLARWGTKELKDHYLPALVNGDLLSLGLYVTESDAGSDVAAMSTTANRERHGYVVNGEKMFVSGAQWDEIAVVACKTNPKEGHRGISLLLIELSSPGIERTKLRSIGWHTSELGGISFRDVVVPSSNLIGEENRGFAYLLECFEAERIFWSCASVGIAEGSVDETIDYVKQRKQFGRPIGKFEAVQHRIVESATLLEAAKWFSYRTLWLKEHKKPVTKESAMLKWWTNEVAYKVVNDMMTNKGAYAYTSDCLDDIRLRELKGASVAGGTSDIQRLIVAREILGKEFDPLR